jgi:hypothetical protein
MTEQNVEIGDSVRISGQQEIVTVIGTTEGHIQVQLGSDASTMKWIQEDNIELVSKATRPKVDPALTPKHSLMDVGY